VALMGSNLMVTSEVGVGTTFWFHCTFKPAIETSTEPQPLAIQETPDPHAPSGPIRVLLAEDNEVNQLYATAMLQALACDVVIAADGEEALAHWRRQEFDIVLMDWHMPALDGLEVTARIREEERQRGLRRTPIIGATASALEDEKRCCIEAGMDAVLCKPFAPPDLVSLLQRWRGRLPASQALLA
jgi:CheY-like chemotaxis protein